VDQFERIINDSGLVTLTRLTDEEITGTPDSPGLIEKYFSLSLDDTNVAGYGTESRRVPRGQQARLPAHALRHGRPAGAREYGEPLRTSLDRPFGLPALVRGTGGRFERE